MRVLSLFDGMSCGQIALKELGIKVVKYYASEIDKHAIKQSKLNFPEMVHLGDVTKWKEWDIDWKNIDLVLAGSPCQGFSFAGKQLAFDDPRSALFFVFVDILQYIQKLNPDVKYLLENVKMKQEHELVISKYMNVHPIEINSALVSAQNRVRLYWSNIANAPYGLFGDMKCTIPQPKDKGIYLKDILEDDVDERYYLSDKIIKGFLKHNEIHQERGNGFKFQPKTREEKSSFLNARYHKMGVDDTYIVASRGRNPENPKSRESGLPTEQMLEPRLDGKPNCLTSVQKDNLVIQINPSKESGGKQPYQQNRIYDSSGKSPALQSQLSTLSNMVMLGNIYDNGHNSVAGRVYTDSGKSVTLQAEGGGGGAKTGLYFTNSRIRRLTPKECARLQTIPDWYKWECSDTQIYRMLGNGWTVEVIKHILQYIKTPII